MDFFEHTEKNESIGRPLADRMRPRTLSDYIGQSKLLAPDSLLRRAIQEDRLFSMILWGPPGSGEDDFGAPHRQ